jgi:peroxiredoxin
MEGLAVVKISTPRRFEYLQMYKDGDKWKVFHSLIQNNPDYSFNTSLVQSVGHPMSDFTLPVYQGGDFTLSKEKGKNVILLFPRGWLGDHWCQVCQYQYAEFLELIKTKRLLEKYNCEVVFVLPYSKEKVDDWVSRFNDGLRTLEGWKQSTNKEFAEYITTNYTKKTDLKNDEFTIPILVDAEGKLSQRFQLFTSFWDGIRSEQNIPTIFIVDKQGIIQFKYHSQSTFDRPSADYLVKYLKNLQN